MKKVRKSLLLGLVLPCLSACGAMKADKFTEALNKQLSESKYFEKKDGAENYSLKEDVFDSWKLGYSTKSLSFSYNQMIEGVEGKFTIGTTKEYSVNAVTYCSEKYFSLNFSQTITTEFKKQFGSVEKKDEDEEEKDLEKVDKKTFVQHAERELVYACTDKENFRKFDIYSKCKYKTVGEAWDKFDYFVPLDDEEVVAEIGTVEITEAEEKDFKHLDSRLEFVSSKQCGKFNFECPISNMECYLPYSESGYIYGKNLFQILIASNTVSNLVDTIENYEKEEYKPEYKKLSYNKSLGGKLDCAFNIVEKEDETTFKEITENYSFLNALPVDTSTYKAVYNVQNNEKEYQSSETNEVKIEVNNSFTKNIPSEKGYERLDD